MSYHTLGNRHVCMTVSLSAPDMADSDPVSQHSGVSIRLALVPKLSYDAYFSQLYFNRESSLHVTNTTYSGLQEHRIINSPSLISL
jgi:hypothetical protein